MPYTDAEHGWWRCCDLELAPDVDECPVCSRTVAEAEKAGDVRKLMSEREARNLEHLAGGDDEDQDP